MTAALIGRRHPVEALRAEITRTADSHGGLVLVTGEAGIGKTTLVGAAAEEARRRGALVLGGSCWDSDSAPGFWPWVQVVRALWRGVPPAEWATIAQVAGSGLGVLLGESPGPGPGGPPRAEPDRDRADAFALYDAVTSALVAASQRRPVVVALDDLHWADAASLRLLEFAAQHTWFERLLLIGTYRDVEVETPEHPLRALMVPLVTKATTVTLTGLERDEVGALMARTAGEKPAPELVAEVHLRTGGNPFFVEQTARLWSGGGSVTGVAPGVRDAVARRLSLLPPPVVELLTTAAVLGREFHRQVLAAVAAAPVPQVDRLLDQAVTARLAVVRGAGLFSFAHDLVRETLYGSLDDAEVRRRHTAVVRALDRSPALAERVFVADQARHGYLAGGEVPPARATELLVAAARDASARLAMEEAVGQYRRALELVGADDRQRATVALQLGMELHHSGERADGWRAFSEAIAACRRVGDPELMARVAITLYRYDRDGNGQLREEIIRAAHCALVGARPAATTIDGLVQELIHRTSVQARRAKDDETLAFSLAARHDAIWGLGTASERQALTEEIEAAARRSADRDLEQYASSLRWVALLEQGDPRYLSQLGAFVALAERYDTPRMSGGAVVDRAIIAGLAGRFDEAETLLDQSSDHGHDHPDFTWMLRHVRWTLMLRQGRFDEADRLVQEFGEPGRAAVRLVDGLTAVERGDGERARRLLAELTAVAPAGGDPADSTADVRADGGTAAPPWSIEARGELARALLGRGGTGDAAAAATLLDEVERAATDIGMPHIAERARRVRAGVPDQPEDERRAPPAGAEFRWDGTVWTLRYAGCTVHLPDAKGLRDLHVLLSRAGQDVTAVELLAPAGGELVVAARRLGADPVLDDEAKARYRRRLAQLDDEIDRAGERGDQRRAIEVDREREALLAELRAAAGLGGRTRRLGDEAERARKTVTARIRDTLRRLDEHHPELVAHLRARENRHRPGDRDVRAGQDVRPDPGGGRHRPRRTGWRGLRSARAQRGRQDHRDPDAGHPAAARRRRGPGVRPRRGPRRRRGTQPGQPDRPVRVGRALAGSPREYLQYLLPGIMVTSVVMITMYTGLGLNADIEKGVFDRFRSLPIWRPAALVGMILGDLLRYVLAATMILGVGLVLGFRPAGGVAGVLAGIGLLVVFSFAFSWIWTMFGLLLRSEKSVMGVSMLVLFPLTFLSNVFVDPTTMPGWLQAFVDVNPISPIWSPRCAA